jgi:prephenate dehydratase
VLALELAGIQPGWSPLSLTPNRTWGSALALAPPAAFFLAVLSLSHIQRERLVQVCIAAAIASKRAADLFGLNVLAENIEDDAKNTTRFLVLGAHDVAPSGHDKTSLVMTSKNTPGAMVQLLEPLARHGVSMTKFESRPSKQGLWDYVFFVDIEGHQHDAKVQAALAECEQRASFLKVLGSYPAAII